MLCFASADLLRGISEARVFGILTRYVFCTFRLVYFAGLHWVIAASNMYQIYIKLDPHSYAVSCSHYLVCGWHWILKKLNDIKKVNNIGHKLGFCISIKLGSLNKRHVTATQSYGAVMKTYLSIYVLVKVLVKGTAMVHMIQNIPGVLQLDTGGYRGGEIETAGGSTSFFKRWRTNLTFFNDNTFWLLSLG